MRAHKRNHRRVWVVSCAALLFVSLLSACEFEDTITPIAWPDDAPESEIEPLPDEDGSIPPALDLEEREAMVQEAIDDGDYQLAIELTVELYGIDISNAAGMPQYSEDMPGAYATTDPGDGSILVGDAAFSSPGTLATTIGHEVVHTNQMAEGRAYLDVDEDGVAFAISDQGYFVNELEAWMWELDHAEENGLPEEEIEIIQDSIDYYYNLLSEENQELVDSGIWVLPDVEPAAP